MKCSFIVSAYDRPSHLACLLWSLHNQTEKDFQVIVCDNSGFNQNNLRVFQDLGDARFYYISMSLPNCYYTTEIGAIQASGEYLCFPSDDNYYVPQFLKTMLQSKADIISCDMLYDPRINGYYSVIDVAPVLGKVDKGGFLIKRDKYFGFPAKEFDLAADGCMIEKAVNVRGLSWEKVKGVLWVHN